MSMIFCYFVGDFHALQAVSSALVERSVNVDSDIEESATDTGLKIWTHQTTLAFIELYRACSRF